MEAHDGTTRPYYFPDDLAKHVKKAREAKSEPDTPSGKSKPFADS